MRQAIIMNVSWNVIWPRLPITVMYFRVWKVDKVGKVATRRRGRSEEKAPLGWLISWQRVRGPAIIIVNQWLTCNFGPFETVHSDSPIRAIIIIALDHLVSLEGGTLHCSTTAHRFYHRISMCTSLQAKDLCCSRSQASTVAAKYMSPPPVSKRLPVRNGGPSLWKSPLQVLFCRLR